MLGKDNNWILAGIAAAITLPVLVWLGMPFWIALVLVLIAFAGLLFLLAPKTLFEGLNFKGIGRERLAFARDLLTEAAPSADRLKAAGNRIKDPEIRQRVAHLAEIAGDIFDKVEAQPARAPAVRRFLSYYLPRAADVSEGYAVIEAKRAPNPQRLADVAAMVEKLEGAFVHYSDGLAESELGTLDVDLRLIEASMKEDLER